MLVTQAGQCARGYACIPRCWVRRGSGYERPASAHRGLSDATYGRQVSNSRPGVESSGCGTRPRMQRHCVSS
jgi:hypothetical protein